MIDNSDPRLFGRPTGGVHPVSKRTWIFTHIADKNGIGRKKRSNIFFKEKDYNNDPVSTELAAREAQQIWSDAEGETVNTCRVLDSGLIEMDVRDGFVTRFSPGQLDKMIQQRWWSRDVHGLRYAETKINGKHIPCHRYLLGVFDPSVVVDHKDGNGLHNEDDNIWITDQSKNTANRKIVNCWTGVPGVNECWKKNNDLAGYCTSLQMKGHARDDSYFNLSDYGNNINATFKAAVACRIEKEDLYQMHCARRVRGLVYPEIPLHVNLKRPPRKRKLKIKKKEQQQKTPEQALDDLMEFVLAQE
jgi:hypothetical protein